MSVHWNKRKPVFGWGINDLPYTVKSADLDESGKRVDPCPYYDRWMHILKRAKSEKAKAKTPCYSEAGVCDDWQRASVFKAWMETQVWSESMTEITLHLDKDILIPGNKMYSPASCAFVPRQLNGVIIILENNLGIPGVKKRSYTPKSSSQKYSATITERNVKLFLGDADTPEGAHKLWQLAKIDRIETELEVYRKMDCYRSDVDEAMTRRIDQIYNDHKNGEVTYKL